MNDRRGDSFARLTSHTNASSWNEHPTRADQTAVRLCFTYEGGWLDRNLEELHCDWRQEDTAHVSLRLPTTQHSLPVPDPLPGPTLQNNAERCSRQRDSVLSPTTWRKAHLSRCSFPSSSPNPWGLAQSCSSSTAHLCTPAWKFRKAAKHEFPTVRICFPILVATRTRSSPNPS